MIRKTALALIIAFAAYGAANAQTMHDAAQLYRDGDYAHAREAYEVIIARTERPGAALHYDLGNAYFKEAAPHALGRATAHWLSAWELAPRDADVRHNLEFALQRAGETLVPPGTPRALFFIFHWLSWHELLGLQWLGYWACLLLGAAWLLQTERRHALAPWLVFALGFWATAGSWLGLRWAAAPKEPGVILEPNAEARSGPGVNFPVSFNAPEGRRVSILSESGDWDEVGVVKEGLKGWVLKKNVERL